jgi:predicted HicB family RNase H-like nuclease
MPKPTAPREPHRSFTVRVTETLYEQIGEAALADGMFVNEKVNQLLRLGMGQHISLDAAVSRLLRKEMTADV